MYKKHEIIAWSYYESWWRRNMRAMSSSWHDHNHASSRSWYDHGKIMAWQLCFFSTRGEKKFNFCYEFIRYHCGLSTIRSDSLWNSVDQHWYFPHSVKTRCSVLICCKTSNRVGLNCYKDFWNFIASLFKFYSMQPDCFDYNRICPGIKDPNFYTVYVQKYEAGELGQFSNAKLPLSPDCSEPCYRYA